jgi:hypothetical protein
MMLRLIGALVMVAAAAVPSDKETCEEDRRDDK